MSKGILGGTFDVLHDGHRSMLHTAFRQSAESRSDEAVRYGICDSGKADDVIVGVTSDEQANESRDRDVRPVEERIEDVRDECRTLENLYGVHSIVVELEDGVDAENEVADFIVVSPEQKVVENVHEINEKRMEKPGLSRLRVVEAPMITDYNDRKISATRIREGEIDEHGRVIEE